MDMHYALNQSISTCNSNALGNIWEGVTVVNQSHGSWHYLAPTRVSKVSGSLQALDLGNLAVTDQDDLKHIFMANISSMQSMGVPPYSRGMQELVKNNIVKLLPSECPLGNSVGNNIIKKFTSL